MNIWTGLLFLEGAVADVPLARELARDEVRAATVDAASTAARQDRPTATPLYPCPSQGTH
ncbi:hypothetical protein [Lysobacter solisilvae (ex Woo and Kim 2020)]|uniref:Uncharacterized protein n=1 Tax=Agrilutibacter terrestris TaxID=2865112 RepID=A0A7H0G0Y9_9GAMM|nr:hypothetical protein [Lysobacter terrestris]QNP41955.1 hypothetical protein H8B22_07115 [Lysobacter terrestris]